MSALLTARTRSNPLVRIWRTQVFLIPTMLLSVGAGVGLFALTGSMGLGLVVLFVLVMASFWWVARKAARVDFERDAANPHVRLEPDALVVPFEGGEKRFPLGVAKVASGWYDRRFQQRFQKGGAGVFLYLEHDDTRLVVLADDFMGDAPERGIKRYSDAPDGYPYVFVWSRELIPIIARMGAIPREAARSGSD